MKNLALALLALTAFAAGCRHPKDAAPDYDATRARSEQSHQDLDNQGK